MNARGIPKRRLGIDESLHYWQEPSPGTHCVRSGEKPHSKGDDCDSLVAPAKVAVMLERRHAFKQFPGAFVAGAPVLAVDALADLASCCHLS